MNGVIETADGSYLVAGCTDNGISYDKTVASEGQEDMWLVKLDNTGIYLARCYWRKLSEYSGGVIQTNDGGYAVYCSSWSGDFRRQNRSEHRNFLIFGLLNLRLIVLLLRRYVITLMTIVRELLMMVLPAQSPYLLQVLHQFVRVPACL
ncbi:MAG: hypothetical protein IPO47_19465 [Bacteroidetes bacterium]|nr:hypothetical protein [Bacteroidota bacterium]